MFLPFILKQFAYIKFFWGLNLTIIMHRLFLWQELFTPHLILLPINVVFLAMFQWKNQRVFIIYYWFLLLIKTQRKKTKEFRHVYWGINLNHKFLELMLMFSILFLVVHFGCGFSESITKWNYHRKLYIK